MTAALAFVFRLFRVLAELDVPFAVGGSFASSEWGQPRQTRDLDLAVMITADQAAALETAVSEEFMVESVGMREALSSDQPFRSFQLYHYAENFKVDVFAMPDDAYSREYLARVRPVSIDGTDVPFASPEDTVIAKLRWFELGNPISDRQWNDIVQILERQAELLDVAYLLRWTAAFGVSDLFAEAQSQALA